MSECPCCGGAAHFLGALGVAEWFRCTDCGVDFSTRAETTEDDDDADAA